MKRVAIYCRVSTQHQTAESQQFELRRFCQLRGFEIHREYLDVTSGSKSDRPALNQLLADSKKRRFDAVLVFRFDRMARSTSHLLNLLNEFNALKVDFISFQENIDTSTPMGQAMFTIIAAMAQLERDIIRERVLAGIQAARAKGTKLGRPKLRQETQAQALRDKGLSIRQIAKQLNTSIGSVQRSIKSTKRT